MAFVTEDNSAVARRLNLKLYRVALALALAFLALCLFRPLMDNVDLGWHVAQGRWMAQHHSVYRHDLMNYPSGGRSIINEYPLFQLALVAAWNLGQGGLYIFTLALYGLLFFLLIKTARDLSMSGSALFALTLTLMLFYFQLAFPLRPHTVTYLAIGILGIFLLRHRAAGSWTAFWPMALLQVIWTNSHSAFVLGPMMVGIFGFEMVMRKSFEQRRLAWPVLRAWGGAFLLILLACLVNPFGWMRFYPPLYQGSLQEIRAYVGEMQPLTGMASSLIALMTLVAAASVVLAVARARGGVSFGFLFLSALLYMESLSVVKSWPVFGVFLPLLVLSTGAFGHQSPPLGWSQWAQLSGNLVVTLLLVMGLYLRLDPNSMAGIPVVWKEYKDGRGELPYQAVDWMRTHSIQGRMLNRCEYGGLLQERGYDRGQTFSDTGFGKYNEKLIRIVCMIGDRPALLPLYCSTYRPAFVVCNTMCFRWPCYLRQLGWRMIFYSMSGTVWTRPDIRTDLPTITGSEMTASFSEDIQRDGRPADPLFLGRNLLALNSAGEEDFAFSQLRSTPPQLHRLPWYWETARIMCFETPRLSIAHQQQLLAEAQGLHEDMLTAEFRAFVAAEGGNAEGARAILESVPANDRDSHASDLLLKIDNEQHRPEALKLARSRRGVDLRDGLHWSYVAQAEDGAGHENKASQAWSQAIFYYPDDPSIAAAAMAFAARTHDDGLSREVERRLDLRVH